MSQKFTICCKGAYLLALLGSIFLFEACDPCRELAEEICKCSEGDEQRRCLSSLSLAHEHEYLKQAKKPEVCEKALIECECKDLQNNADEKCGMHRPINKK